MLDKPTLARSGKAAEDKAVDATSIRAMAKIVNSSNGKFSGSRDGLAETTKRVASLAAYRKILGVALMAEDAPQCMMEILDLSSEEPEAGYHGGANRKIFTLLFLTTKDQAHDVVSRFEDEYDGRLAWINLHSTCMPFNSLSRQELLAKIATFRISNGPPEPQLDILYQMQLQYADARGSPLLEIEIVDAFIASLDRCKTEAYRELVLNLNQNTFVAQTISTGLIRTMAAGAYESFVQVNPWKQKKEGSRDKESRDVFDRESKEYDSDGVEKVEKVAAIAVREETDSSNGKKKGKKKELVCQICKAHGKSGNELNHMYSECSILKEITTDKVENQKKASPARASRIKVTKRTVGKANSEAEIEPSDLDPAELYEYLGDWRS